MRILIRTKIAPKTTLSIALELDMSMKIVFERIALAALLTLELGVQVLTLFWWNIRGCFEIFVVVYKTNRYNIVNNKYFTRNDLLI